MSRSAWLLKTNNPLENNNESDHSAILIAKKQISEICKTLCLDTQKYEARKSVEQISSYIASSEMNRILYSEISHYLFVI